MEANKQYITQLTAADLQELARLTHLEAGDGLTMTPTHNGLRIELDVDYLKFIMSKLGVAWGEV